MSAVLDDITSACVSTLQGVSFSGLDPANIKRRMLPKVGETLDAVPCIIVAPGDEDSIKPISFEGLVEVRYPVEVAVVAAVNRDYSTKLPTFLLWREQARKALLQSTFSGAATVYKIDYQDSPIFDRAELNSQYGFNSFTLLFWSVESRN